MSAIINPRLPTDWVVGLHCALGVDADHDVDVTAGVVRDESDVFDLISAGALAFQLDAAVGIGALDTGVPANNTWYALYLAGKSDGTVGLLGSLEATYAGIIGNADNPAGYDWGRRIGYLRTDGSANLKPFIQSPSAENFRWWFWDWNGFTNGLLAENDTATTFTDCPDQGGGDDLFAPSAVQVQYRVSAARTGTDSTFAVITRPKAMTLDRPGWRTNAGLGGAGNDSTRSGHMMAPTNVVAGGRVIQYERDSTAGTARVLAVGWEDRI